MILELACAAGCLYGIYFVIGIFNGRYKYKRKWQGIMRGAKIKNEFGNTYEVIRTEPKEDGCFMTVSMPPGLSFNKLKECEHILETGFNADIGIVWNRNSGNAEVTIINRSRE